MALSQQEILVYKNTYPKLEAILNGNSGLRIFPTFFGVMLTLFAFGVAAVYIVLFYKSEKILFSK